MVVSAKIREVKLALCQVKTVQVDSTGLGSHKKTDTVTIVR